MSRFFQETQQINPSIFCILQVEIQTKNKLADFNSKARFTHFLRGNVFVYLSLCNQ